MPLFRTAYLFAATSVSPWKSAQDGRNPTLCCWFPLVSTSNRACVSRTGCPCEGSGTPAWCLSAACLARPATRENISLGLANKLCCKKIAPGGLSWLRPWTTWYAILRQHDKIQGVTSLILKWKQCTQTTILKVVLTTEKIQIQSNPKIIKKYLKL